MSFGPYQFAYSKEPGARDALLFLVLSWLRSFSEGKRVALFSSDVSGAFDRISSHRLHAKLQASGLHPSVVRVLESWLQPRTAEIVVNGSRSRPLRMVNMIYQGTVFGPCLWNLFYSDVRIAVHASGFTEIIFADDLNSHKALGPEISDETAFALLDACQTEIHAWGRANSVSFDSAKEGKYILSLSAPVGGNFRILGIDFDCKLAMHDAIYECAVEAGWRSFNILHSRRFFPTRELVVLYKAHVLSYIEFRTPGISHASSSRLAILDAVQTRFLQALELSPEEALINFRLAPLPVRRDMAILGLIHRTLLGRGPPCFAQFFALGFQARRTRSRHSHRHQRHLVDPCNFNSQEFVLRSPLGAVRLYNILPDSIIAQATVQDFQHMLQSFLIERASRRDSSWQELLSWRQGFAFHPLLRFRGWHP